MLRSLLLAVSFLTIIPVRFRTEITERHMLTSGTMFPVVGVMLGMLAVGADALFGFFFGPEISMALVVFTLEAATGGLHLDGLSDTFDAMGSKAGQERRMEIMREGTAGPHGVAAMIFTLAIKYLALLSAANLSYFAFYATLLFMPAVGRWAMLAGMLVGRSARADGLGQVFIGRLGLGRFALGTIMLLGVMMGPALALPSEAPSGWMGFVIIALLLVMAYVLLARWVSNRRFGGFTGDVLGAIGETVEAGFVLMVIAWSRLYTL